MQTDESTNKENDRSNDEEDKYELKISNHNKINSNLIVKLSKWRQRAISICAALIILIESIEWKWGKMCCFWTQAFYRSFRCTHTHTHFYLNIFMMLELSFQEEIDACTIMESVTFILRNKMELRWLLIRLYGWCNLVLPLLQSFMCLRTQWFCIHVKRSAMLLNHRKISSYYGHEHRNCCCFHILKRADRSREIERRDEWMRDEHESEWKRSIEWCTELMTWQSSSIKCVWLLWIWHCSRQVFRTIIFTDSIWVVMKYVKHVPIDWQTEFYCHHFYLVHPNAFLFEHIHAALSSFLRIIIWNASLSKTNRIPDTQTHAHTHTCTPNIYYTNILSDCLNITFSASICSFCVSLFLCRFFAISQNVRRQSSNAVLD